MHFVLSQPSTVSSQTSMQHAHTGHTAFLCSGDVWPATGGSWIGHVLPGVFLVSWGLHWFISATFQSLTGTARKRYGGAAYHKVVFFPPQLQVSSRVALLQGCCQAMALPCPVGSTSLQLWAPCGGCWHAGAAGNAVVSLGTAHLNAAVCCRILSPF